MKKTILLPLAFVLLIARLPAQYHQGVPELPPPVDSIAGQIHWEIPQLGEWRFVPRAAPDGHLWTEENVLPLDVVVLPNEWQMLGRKVQIGDTAGFYKDLRIPETWKGNVVRLRFEGIYCHGTVFVNGRKAGEVKHPFTTYDFDITDLVNYGKISVLYVKVTGQGLGDSLTNASYFAARNLGGITGYVTAYAVPECHYQSLHVRTRFDSLYENAWMIADYTLTNTTNERKRVAVDINMADTAGNVIFLGQGIDRRFNMNAGQTLSFSDSFLIESPVKWDPEHPALYALKTRLFVDRGWQQWTTRKFGFREIEVRGNQVFVNNRPIKLRGVNLHAVEPYRGRVMRGSTIYRDLQILRQANVNYIRHVGYPPDWRFLDFCDELGFFVEVEAPFNHAHASMEDGGSGFLLPESMRKEHITEPILRMVHEHMSHPSVLMWSLGNETEHYKEYFRKAAAAVRKLDPYRPLVFSQHVPEADLGELEIGNHHFPGPGGLSLYENTSRPIVFDAYAHLFSSNHRELLTDPGLRDQWGAFAASMWEEMYRTEGILGGALWAGIDDFNILYQHPYGFGLWGMMDIWRRSKPEYWHVLKTYSPVRIQKNPASPATGNRMILDLENRHDFTNLDECSVTWKCGQDSGVVQVNIPPRSTGQTVLELPEKRNGEAVEITVTDPRGVTVQRVSIPLEQTVKSTREKRRPSLKYDRTEGELLIQSASLTWVLDEGSGLLTARQNGDTLLLHSPALMILPLNREGKVPFEHVGYTDPGPVTQIAGQWSLSSIHVESMKRKKCLIKVEGAYQEATGSFTYEISRDDQVSISYEYTLKQEISPRQAGLVLEFKDSLPVLSWQREGLWSFYPDNHIGRTSGKARTDTSILSSWVCGPMEPPANGWEDDRNALGSNDFRSTRTSILSAGLHKENGQGIEVVSDGSQSIRAWQLDGITRLLVADFNDPGLFRLYDPSGEPSTAWKKGKRISGQVRFRVTDAE
jgi:hypothetical protein